MTETSTAAQAVVDDLKTALGETSEHLMLKGRKVVVRELTAEDLLEVIPLFDQVKLTAVEVVELINPATNEKDQYFQTNYLKLVTGAAPIVFTMLERLTGEKDTWLKKLPLSDLLKLVRLALSVNRSFFDEIEALKTALENSGIIKGKAPAAGSDGPKSPQFLDEETLARMN